MRCVYCTYLRRREGGCQQFEFETMFEAQVRTGEVH